MVQISFNQAIGLVTLIGPDIEIVVRFEQKLVDMFIMVRNKKIMHKIFIIQSYDAKTGMCPRRHTGNLAT